VLHRAGHDVALVLPEMGFTSRSITSTLARAAGVGKLVAGGKTAGSLTRAASHLLREISHGLVAVYIADADGAGHAHGLLSEPYLAAARTIDRALESLVHVPAQDLVIVMSDHGGGGIDPRDHDTPHPANERIALVLAGPHTRRDHKIERPVSLLDVPPTILWALGAEVPVEYQGRTLRDAFRVARAVAPA
jgi:phosphopentomutase